jgi:hypothetical protein
MNKPSEKMTDAEFKKLSHDTTDLVHITITEVEDVLFRNTKGLTSIVRWLIFARVVNYLWRGLYGVQIDDRISGEVNDRP